VRILCVTHNYPRQHGDLAGAFIERLNVALARRAHSVAVLTPADGGRGGRETLHGIDVRRFRYAPRGWETLAHRGALAAAVGSPAGLLALMSLMGTQARAIARWGNRPDHADVVHAHWWVPAGISARLARPFHNAPYVVTLHGTDVAVLERSALARSAARRVLRAAAAVTAVSRYLADRAAALTGLERERVVVQPMPLDVERYGRPSGGGAGVVTVGRLTPQKHVAVIIDAVAHLHRGGRPVPLTIVGDGPERPALERRAADAGIAPATRFVGAVAPDRVPDAIGDADVFAFAAVREGLGLAVAEALMLGVPVVATREGGGVLDLVAPTGSGRLVPARDPAAMAAAIADLLADPDARRTAAQAGVALRERFDPSTGAQRFEALFTDVVQARPHG